MGLVIKKTEVVFLMSFPCVVVKKDISNHLRSCKFSDAENEVDLILSRVSLHQKSHQNLSLLNFKYAACISIPRGTLYIRQKST